MALKEQPLRIALPSGRIVPNRGRATTDRSWEAIESRGTYFVARQKRGNTSELEYYKGNMLVPHPFSQADANFLAAALNAFSKAPAVQFSLSSLYKGPKGA